MTMEQTWGGGEPKTSNREKLFTYFAPEGTRKPDPRESSDPWRMEACPNHSAKTGRAGWGKVPQAHSNSLL